MLKDQGNFSERRSFETLRVFKEREYPRLGSNNLECLGFSHHKRKNTINLGLNLQFQGKHTTLGTPISVLYNVILYLFLNVCNNLKHFMPVHYRHN